MLTRVAVVALAVAVAAPAAMATCNPAKPFSGFQSGAVNSPILLDATSATVAAGSGQWRGRIWQSDDSTVNNFAVSTTTCRPANPGAGGGWLFSLPGGNPIAAIAGVLNGNNNCTGLTGCPSGNLTLLLEEENNDGSDAFLVLLRTNEDVTSPPFNFLTLAANYAELAFPRPRVTTSNRGLTTVTIDWRLPNADPNFTGRDSGGTLSADSTIVSYDLYEANGTDQGREAANWNLVSQTPYVSAADGADTGYSVDCSNEAVDKVYAVGLTMTGGGGPDVATELVGASTTVECDPTLAEPDQRRKPRTIQSNPKTQKSR